MPGQQYLHSSALSEIKLNPSIGNSMNAKFYVASVSILRYDRAQNPGYGVGVGYRYLGLYGRKRMLQSTCQPTGHEVKPKPQIRPCTLKKGVMLELPGRSFGPHTASAQGWDILERTCHNLRTGFLRPELKELNLSFSLDEGADSGVERSPSVG
jgi:hypothetical protein